MRFVCENERGALARTTEVNTMKNFINMLYALSVHLPGLFLEGLKKQRIKLKPVIVPSYPISSAEFPCLFLEYLRCYPGFLLSGVLLSRPVFYISFDTSKTFFLFHGPSLLPANLLSSNSCFRSLCFSAGSEVQQWFFPWRLHLRLQPSRDEFAQSVTRRQQP